MSWPSSPLYGIDVIYHLACTQDYNIPVILDQASYVWHKKFIYSRACNHSLFIVNQQFLALPVHLFVKTKKKRKKFLVSDNQLFGQHTYTLLMQGG